MVVRGASVVLVVYKAVVHNVVVHSIVRYHLRSNSEGVRSAGQWAVLGPAYHCQTFYTCPLGRVHSVKR